MTAYRELIERLEQAWGPDQIADCYLFEMHWKEGEPKGPPRYTASIDAAVELVGRMLPGWKWRVEPDFAAVFDAGGAWTRCAEAGGCKSAPIALCIALLRALEAQSKDKEEGE